MSEEKEMTFLDHLEVRWHFIRAALAVVVLTVVSFMYVPWIYENILFAPAKVDFPTFTYMCKLGDWVGMRDALCVTELPFKVQSRNMTGQFMMSLTASFVIGIIVAFPYVVWEFWGFIRPGLETKERRFSRGLDCQRILGPDVDVALDGTDGISGDSHPFDDGMRIGLQD